MSLVIHAPNVHQGGGRALLTALLRALEPGMARLVILDVRFRVSIELPPDVRVVRVSPTVVGRLSAEWRLSKHAEPGDTVLCFGNLPPLFALRGKAVVYVQNRYHAWRGSLRGFPMSVRARIWMEYRWFDFGKRYVTSYFVQTPSMQEALRRNLGIHAEIMPFVERASNICRRATSTPVAGKRQYDFIYVASGDPHKNHRNLVEAWCLLAREQCYPTLCLTLDASKDVELCGWIESRKSDCGVKIDLGGVVDPAQLGELYQSASALIYPSGIESFGLPLIEARQAGLPIVAAELDYVRDIVDPEECFDPQSPVSIARAVRRFMKWPEDPLPVADAVTVLRRLIGRSS